jgi:hypothetical protein
MVGAVLITAACSAVTSREGHVISQDFEPIAAVLTYPRCINCHTTTNFPRQGDDRHPHRFNVQRGDANHGAAGLQCSTCHTDRNQEASGVPGAPHWGLAPLSMGWEGLDARQLCERIKDPNANGNRTLDQLQHHMTDDALVQWAWTPGAHRTTPPRSQEEFHQAVRTWIAHGARC